MALTRPLRSNEWSHQRDSDEADVLRRGVQFESVTNVVSIRYSNNDRLYLVTPPETVRFASATKNSGVTNIIRNLSAGNVIASTAGGTLLGSATQAAADACTMWRSNGTQWVRLFTSDATDPLNVGSINVAGSASFSGSVNFLSVVDFQGSAEFHSSASFSGSVAFGVQPNFPNGTVTSITGGAMIVFAGNILYEMSPGASTVELILPDPTTVLGQRRVVKIKAGSTGTIELKAPTGGVEGNPFINITGQYEAGSFIAGLSTWHIEW